ncbi:response regulator transcription factor [Nocardioides lijunqiniae]|uniref:response regulator transcription factor n=1 Tax=Nocardioides lijunqiniae TaxID=2760832 RepID=UPI001D0C767B|nr:response regulator transcription factor [Nocardioides lijunqiniae]
MPRILVAEDDPKQAELIRRYATAEGHDVTLVVDGREAVDHVRRQVPDLLILDVMMPRLDGLDVCRILRASPEAEAVPILMLTARRSEDELLHGLDLGADDYLTKPYSPRELMARVRSLLRRHGVSASGAVRPPVVLGELTLTPATHEVRFAQRVVACTSGEFTLLEALATEPGRVFSREQLLTRLHGPHAAGDYISRRTIDVHVANLRKKLDPAVIRTVHGVGYSAPQPAPDR